MPRAGFKKTWAAGTFDKAAVQALFGHIKTFVANAGFNVLLDTIDGIDFIRMGSPAGTADDDIPHWAFSFQDQDPYGAIFAYPVYGNDYLDEAAYAHSYTIVHSAWVGNPSPEMTVWFAADGFAILAPHRAQNSAIRGLLAERGFGQDGRPMPLVDTVDKLQGQERDVVVVSYGVADEEYAEAEAEFLLSSNRFNVATTRPRHKLIVLCSNAVLDVVPQDREVLLEAMMLKEFRNFCDGGMRVFTLETGEYGPVEFSVQWKGFAQLETPGSSAS